MRGVLTSSFIIALISLGEPWIGEASAAVGGPDSLGWYTYVDQADGAPYNYVDITATGTPIVTGGIYGISIPLSQPFFVYGHTVERLLITADGILSTDHTALLDNSNDCGLPATPSSGDGFRIYGLHDDLTTSTYHQYFDAAAAAAIGFPGTTGGVTVFQWVGTHTGGGPVDHEVVLFHDTYDILSMVAVDAEGGASSTMGIQSDADSAVSAGLQYTCETPGGIVPGVTAVLYSLTPDSDCCSASLSGAPGCLNAICQTAVCAGDPFCCTNEWDGLCASDPVTGATAVCSVLCGGPPPPITINEIRLDQPGIELEEYFEVTGPPGTSLDGLQYIVVGGSPNGEIDEVVDLSGHVIPPDGHLVVAEASFTLAPPPDLTEDLFFRDSDTATHMLVVNLTAGVGNNVDNNFDGVLDLTPWDAVVDTIAIVDPVDNTLPYGPINPEGGPPACIASPTCQQITGPFQPPMHVRRCNDAIGPFISGVDSPYVATSSDTPGQPNSCCGDGFVSTGEGCDGDGMGTGGETATCNVDCSVSVCGDGILNATAGEECDDAMMTATCDADCTAAMCGDGEVNVAAGEGCDGDGMGTGGETAACDLDCTAAQCGDGLINATSGEECDGDGMGLGGETATCDADCTLAVCGDGVVNPMSGETCDGDGMGAGGRTDQCDVDCTVVTCGDGIVNAMAGEECDGDGIGTGGETEACDEDCTNASCGDMVVNATAGEACDDGRETEACDEDCTGVACGDGLVNEPAGEECDDGNTNAGDGCDASCLEEPIGTGDTGMDETAGPADATEGMADGSGDGTGNGTSTGLSSLSDTGSATDADTETDGGIVSGDEGCRCSSGDRSPASWWGLALLGLGLVRRRRRACA